MVTPITVQMVNDVLHKIYRMFVDGKLSTLNNEPVRWEHLACEKVVHGTDDIGTETYVVFVSHVSPDSELFRAHVKQELYQLSACDTIDVITEW